MPQSGDTLPGPIRLESELYRRNTGSIWSAFHEGRGQRVSVKIPSAETLRDDDDLEQRLRLESRATTEIRSPHVVRVVEDGRTESGTPFVVMEELVGEPLSALIERRAPLPLADVDRIVGQVAGGLSAAHAVGIVHRDINPETIFLHGKGSRPTVKIVDFGIAKVVGGRLDDLHLTRHGRLLGNPAYISPERARAKKATIHADMWALAVVTYEALTGELPFAGGGVGSMLIRIIEHRFEAPSHVAPHLKREVDAWFEQAFAADIDARFNTVHDMATSLSMALAATDNELDWSL